MYWPICFHGFLIGHMGNGKVLTWLFWNPLGFLCVLSWSQDVCGNSVSRTHAWSPKIGKHLFFFSISILKIKNSFLEITQKCLMFYWLDLGSLSLKHWGVGLIGLVQTNQNLSLSQERIHTSWNTGPHRRWASERICQL